MNIGIFDTEHYETAYTLVRLFDIPGNSITVYTNTQCFTILKELFEEQVDKYRWEIQGAGETHASFIRRMNKTVRLHRTELFFYNTVSNNHLLHALMLKNNPGMRSILTLHSINSMLTPPFPSGFKSLVRNIGKKMLMKEVKELNVISETMLGYLNEKTGHSRVIHNIPGSIFEEEPPLVQIIDRICIVIPGTIDRKRRDYSQAIELLIIAENEDLPLDIVLLGAPYEEYGNQIIENARRIETFATSFRVYETIVDQHEFDRQMKAAHFVFIPSVVESTERNGTKEIYGLTKSSGNIFDVIRHAKPYIIPSGLRVPANMEQSAFRYNDVQSILGFLKSVFEDPATYQPWQEKALNSSRNYTIEKVRRSNSSLF